MNVDLEQLIEAFEDASAELNYFVDRETGDVLLVSDTLGFIEAGKQRFEMELAPRRYLAVPIADFTDLDEDLDAFLDRVEDDDLAIALENSLDADEPTKRLDLILSQHEEIAADWNQFRRDRVRKRALTWLKRQRLSAS